MQAACWFVGATSTCTRLHGRSRPASGWYISIARWCRRRVVYTGPAAGTTADSLTAAMLGGDLAPVVQGRPVTGVPLHAPSHAPVIRADRIFVQDARGVTRIRDASLVVRGGEIVGMAA